MLAQGGDRRGHHAGGEAGATTVHGGDPAGRRVGQQDRDAVGSAREQGDAAPGGDQGVARGRDARGLDRLDVGTVHLVHEHRGRAGLVRDQAQGLVTDGRLGGVAEAEGDVGEGDLDDEVAFDPIAVAQVHVLT